MATKILQQPKNQFVVHDDAKQITADDICMLCKGMSLEEFVEDIKRNKNGKYDHLYSTANV